VSWCVSELDYPVNCSTSSTENYLDTGHHACLNKASTYSTQPQWVMALNTTHKHSKTFLAKLLRHLLDHFELVCTTYSRQEWWNIWYYAKRVENFSMSLIIMCEIGYLRINKLFVKANLCCNKTVMTFNCKLPSPDGSR
jgi:hypothetical protein